MKKILFAAVISCFAAVAAHAGPVAVFVSISPQRYFVQQIGKNHVDVQVMVPPGASPHIYEPKPQQMVALSKASIYFAIGVPFEAVWLKKIAAANPQMQVVHTDHGIVKLPMSDGDPHDAAHTGPGITDDDHDHGTRDPHIWLSPPLAMLQARMILSALQAIDPAHHDAYAANYQALAGDIVALDMAIQGAFAGKKERRFMVFHPAWGYFAHTYGLRQVPIELEGKNPKPAQLQSLIEAARKSRISVIFAQPQFSAKSAQLVAREIGGEVVFADPLAEDWMTNLRGLANTFKTALR